MPIVPSQPPLVGARVAQPLRRWVLLAAAKGPGVLLLPTRGVEQWDQPGEPLHDPEGLQAFLTEMRTSVRSDTHLVELDAHINDAAFCEAALTHPVRWLGGLIVDATYSGVLKPDPRAYAAVTEGLGLPAAACLFVDDQRRNVEGALRAGMQAVKFDVRAPASSCAQALRLLGAAVPSALAVAGAGHAEETGG